MPANNPAGHAAAFRAAHVQTFPTLERTPDLSRGEIRFAAEALLAVVRGGSLPPPAFSRALEIADVMAKG